MKQKLAKIFALFMATTMLCTSCGLGSGAPAASGDSSNDSTSGDTNTAASGDKEVTVGLAKNVYEIPDYTNNPPEGARVLRMSVSMGAADYGVNASGVMFKTFADRLKELSGDKMVVQIYPANQLASTTDDIVNGLITNAFEFSEVGVGNWGDYTDAFTMCNVPFLYADDEIAYKVMDSEVGDEAREKFRQDTGLYAPAFCYFGMRTLTNNTREIHTPADLKGLKIRMQNDPMQISMMEDMGASTMTVSFSELFTALQQKLCDGQDNPIVSVVSKKFYEVQHYLTLLNHVPNISMMITSDAFYQSLTDEERGWIDQAAVEAQEACFKANAEATETLLGQLAEYGIDITELTDEEHQQFVDATANTRAKCEEKMGAEKWAALMDAVAAAEG